MKIKSILLLIIIIAFPAMTNASDVPWTSNYSFLSLYSVGGHSNYVEGPPPIEISAYPHFGHVTDSSIYLSIDGRDAEAEASYSGRYIADDHYFNFQYTNDLGGWTRFSVKQDQIYLYDDYLNSGSNTISVPTSIGSDILVNIYSFRFGGFGISPSSLNYNMSTSASAVAPEPISSILFITGGSLLAGRRYLRKKASRRWK